jgi:GT2 family glycosyltransferase
MEYMIKLTCLLSTYHDLPLLWSRLDNLLTQQVDYELIAICEKASDEYRMIQKWSTNGFSTSNKVVKFIETEGIPTLYDAWNQGIEASQGEYITNTNTDDRLYPGALQKMIDVLDNNPDYGLVYPDVDRVAEIDGEPFSQFNWAEGDLDVLLGGCFLGPMPMWRRSLHDKYGLFDGEYHSSGDYEFWLRLAKDGVKFYHLKEVVGAYYDRKESIEHRQPNRTVWETSRARSRYREASY